MFWNNHFPRRKAGIFCTFLKNGAIYFFWHKSYRRRLLSLSSQFQNSLRALFVFFMTLSVRVPELELELEVREFCLGGLGAACSPVPTFFF